MRHSTSSKHHRYGMNPSRHASKVIKLGARVNKLGARLNKLSAKIIKLKGKNAEKATLLTQRDDAINQKKDQVIQQTFKIGYLVMRVHDLKRIIAEKDGVMENLQETINAKDTYIDQIDEFHQDLMVRYEEQEALLKAKTAN